MRCRVVVSAVSVLVVSFAAVAACRAADRAVVRYARFQAGQTVAYGVVEGDRIRQISGDLFGRWARTDKTYPLDEVKLLVPVQAGKVLAIARNYKSHAGNTPASPNCEVFFKVPSCLLPTGGDILLPEGTKEVHAEGELVIVIGRRARDVAPDKAGEYVLGVTCGNDVSARDWQTNDVQWWRAKGSDTFGPCGPFIAAGLNYGDLQLETRVNGEVKQRERTSMMIHNVAAIVSWISRHVTLEPGDLIYTGTTGQTPVLRPGDVVEVELEGVGVLRNNVKARPR